MTDDPYAFSYEALTPHLPDPGLVESLLKDKYGLVTTCLKPLNGYDDRNYCAKVKDEHCNPFLSDVSVREFFVKIVNTRDSKHFQFSDNQRLAMDHLNSKGITCQQEIKKLDGDYFAKMTVDKKGEEETYMVSVRTFLPGTILGDNTLTQPLLYELGVYMRNIHTAFESFYQEFYDTFDPSWSQNNVGDVRAVIHAVHDVEARKIVLEVLDAFEADVLPKRKEFRRGQIHGDPNEQNILLTSDDTTASGLAISGLLDFQDTTRTHPIYDLAILTAYMMMARDTEVPPLDVAGFLLAGYTHDNSLPYAEWMCLQTIIASRMVMSLVYGAYTFMKNPDNPYLITTASKGWSVLKEFWLMDKESVEQRWKEIMETFDPFQKKEP